MPGPRRGTHPHPWGWGECEEVRVQDDPPLASGAHCGPRAPGPVHDPRCGFLARGVQSVRCGQP